MIEVKNISKKFDTIQAVKEISMTIKEGNVFGLIGTNGAGKSTVLRMIAGVLKTDVGEILIDDIPVYENEEAKKKMFFIPDEPYFFANANARDMEQFITAVFTKTLREKTSMNIFVSLNWMKKEKSAPFPRV